MNLRSQRTLERPEGSKHRVLYKAMGYSDYDLERPLIGVANSWNRIVPGHYNLNLVSDYVKQGIHQAGGTPVEFGVIAAWPNRPTRARSSAINSNKDRSLAARTPVIAIIG